MRDDDALIEAHRGIPALAAVLGEPDALVAGVAGAGAEARYVRLKPGTSAVSAVWTGDGRCFRVVAYPPGAHGKLAKDARAAFDAGLAHAVDEARGLGVFADGADRALPGIRAARERHPEIRPLVYKPSRRWVGRCDACGVIVKVHSPQMAAAARAGHTLVAPHVPTAELRAHDAGLGVIETRLIEGAALDAPSPRSAEHERAAGALLAALHAAPVPAGASEGAGDRAEQLRQAAEAVAAIAPDEAERARRIADAARETIARRGERALVHGDFSADQVLVSAAGEPALVDLDRAGVGDPLADIACWAADRIARRDPRGEAALVEGYRAAGGAAPGHDLDGLVAAALLQRAVEPFRTRAEGWRARLSAILDEAEARVGRDPRAIDDPELPGLAVVCAEPGARLIAHRPGRRAVVRVDGPAGTEFVKVVRPRRFESVASRARRVEGLREARAPRVVAEDAALGLLRLESVGERTLLELTADEASGTALVAAAWHATGRALAELHALDPRGLEAHGPEEEVCATRKALEAAAASGAIADEEAERRLASVARRLRELGGRPAATIHRDLHDKQVLLARGADAVDPRVGLIDVDTLAAGDPALDIANLLVHIRLRAAQGLVAPRRAAIARRALLTALREDPRVDPAAWDVVPAYAEATRARLVGVYAVREGEHAAVAALRRDLDERSAARHVRLSRD